MTLPPGADNFWTGCSHPVSPTTDEKRTLPMPQLFNPAARTLAAASFAAALLFAGPAFALDRTASPQLAQASPATPAPAQKPPMKPKKSRVDRVEERIKQLHAELKITPAQEPAWDAVAQAMRDDAKAMEQAIEQRHQAKSMSAVDNLKSYQAIADAHAQGLQKLVPAFQALYASMSPEQQKNADAVFRAARARHHHPPKSKTP
jgi:LTXXQ motif family protein